MVNIEVFFNELEELLDRHLDTDWEWHYEPDKPLSITSETLAQAWEDNQEDLELISHITNRYMEAKLNKIKAEYFREKDNQHIDDRRETLLDQADFLKTKMREDNTWVDKGE